MTPLKQYTGNSSMIISSGVALFTAAGAVVLIFSTDIFFATFIEVGRSLKFGKIYYIMPLLIKIPYNLSINCHKLYPCIAICPKICPYIDNKGGIRRDSLRQNDIPKL
jgi:hypothetical protein